MQSVKLADAFHPPQLEDCLWVAASQLPKQTLLCQVIKLPAVSTEPDTAAPAIVSLLRPQE